MPVSTNNHHTHLLTHPPSVYLAAAGGMNSNNNNYNNYNNNAKCYTLPPSSASSSSSSSDNSANISPITSTSAQMQRQQEQDSTSSFSSVTLRNDINNNKNTNTNTKNLTSMQKFWMNHIVINDRIIPLSKLQPTVGVQPWKETGTPKKFNSWCCHFQREGKCRFGDTCFNAHPKPKSTAASIEAESQHISVLEGNSSKNNSSVGSDQQQKQQQQQNKKNDKKEDIVDRFAALGNTRASAATATVKSTTSAQQKRHGSPSSSLLNDELVPIWCQRDRVKVYYPLSMLNAESMKRLLANKTVSDCYFQSKCKDPTCTFLHMDECYVQKTLTIHSK